MVGKTCFAAPNASHLDTRVLVFFTVRVNPSQRKRLCARSMISDVAELPTCYCAKRDCVCAGTILAADWELGGIDTLEAKLPSDICAFVLQRHISFFCCA